MISMDYFSRRHLTRRREYCYGVFYSKIQREEISLQDSYRAWLVLGQLEKQHHHDAKPMAAAYGYFAKRLAQEALPTDWKSVRPLKQQISLDEFKTVFAAAKGAGPEMELRIRAYPMKNTGESELRKPLAFRPSLRDSARFLEQLSILVGCGVTVSNALNALARSESDAYLAFAIGDISKGLFEGGSSFSDGMARHPVCFPGPVVALVRSGESTGGFDSALKRASELLQKQAKFRGQLLQALSSPFIVFGLGGLLVLAIVKFIIPRFVAVYAQLKVAMPPLSQFVLKLVEVVNSSLFIATFLAFALLFYIFLEPIRQFAFRAALITPVLERWVRTSLAKDLCDILCELQSSGVPLQRCFRILALCTPYDLHRAQMLRASEQITEQGSLSETLAQITTIPRLAVVVTRVGEEVGELDTLLRSLGKLLEEELESSLNQFVTLIEPISLAILGIGIAVLFVGLFLPVYGVIGNL